MNAFLARCFVLVILLLSELHTTASDRDVAELFPAETTAYAEIRKPGDAATAVAALFAGQPSADSLKFIHDRLDRIPTPQRAQAVHLSGLLNLATTPEFLAELKRFPGLAAGLVGFSDRGRPRITFVVQCGESHAAGLLARLFFTTSPTLRRIAEYEGVPIFQHRGFSGPLNDDNGRPIIEGEDGKPVKPKIAAEATDEPTYAYTPGLFVVASDKAAVVDVLKRYRSATATGSLASAPAFQAAKSTRDRGGVYFFAIPPALAAGWDEAQKHAASNETDSPVFAWFKFLVNANTLPVLTGNLRLENDSITLRFEMETNNAAASALRELWASGSVSRDSTKYHLADSLGVVAWSLPKGEARAKAILQLLDARAKAEGVLGRLPSEAVAAAGDLPLRERLAEIHTVSLLYPGEAELPKNAESLPMLVLHMDTDAAAEAWLRSAPKVLALVAGTKEPLTPASETIDGIRILSVTAASLPGKAPLHLGRSGNVLVIGQDRKLVAAVAKGSTPIANLNLSDNVVSFFTLDLGGILNPVEDSDSPDTKKKTQPVPARRPVHRVARGNRAGSPVPGTSESILVGLSKSLQYWPNLIGTLTRREKGFTLEVRLPDAKTAIPSAWAKLLDWVANRPTNQPNGQPRLLYDELDSLIP